MGHIARRNDWYCTVIWLILKSMEQEVVCRDVPLVHPLRSIASKKHGYWRRRTGRASLHVVQAISMSAILWPHISHFYALNGLIGHPKWSVVKDNWPDEADTKRPFCRWSFSIWRCWSMVNSRKKHWQSVAFFYCLKSVFSLIINKSLVYEAAWRIF